MKFLKAHRLLALVIVLLLVNACGDKSASGNADRLREYAGDLINRSLYKQAIAAYEEYLKIGHIKEQEQANVNYIIAGTYFDRLNDYESALTYYLKIKHFYPEEKILMNDVNKRIVACLERLERTEDASQALSESVQLDPNAVTQRRPGEIVAEMGNRQITQGDLDYEISKLSPTIRNQITTKEQKRDFLREFVATELLYDTAQRAGLDKDPEVIEGSFQAKKALMVQKLLQDRVAGKVEIEEGDLELYYQANKDRFVEKDDQGNVVRELPFSEVYDQVSQEFSRRKFQDAYQGLIEKMIIAEGVKFYENRVQ